MELQIADSKVMSEAKLWTLDEIRDETPIIPFSEKPITDNNNAPIIQGEREIVMKKDTEIGRYQGRKLEEQTGSDQKNDSMTQKPVQQNIPIIFPRQTIRIPLYTVGTLYKDRETIVKKHFNNNNKNNTNHTPTQQPHNLEANVIVTNTNNKEFSEKEVLSLYDEQQQFYSIMNYLTNNSMRRRNRKRTFIEKLVKKEERIAQKYNLQKRYETARMNTNRYWKQATAGIAIAAWGIFAYSSKKYNSYKNEQYNVPPRIESSIAKPEENLEQRLNTNSTNPTNNNTLKNESKGTKIESITPTAPQSTKNSPQTKPLYIGTDITAKTMQVYIIPEENGSVLAYITEQHWDGKIGLREKKLSMYDAISLYIATNEDSNNNNTNSIMHKGNLSIQQRAGYINTNFSSERYNNTPYRPMAVKTLEEEIKFEKAKQAQPSQ